MNKKFFILFLFIILLFFVPFFCQISFCKYIFNYSFISSKILINKKPEIEVLTISNTNTNYEKYANKTHTITLKVKVKEKNILTNNFKNDINILINNELVYPLLKITEISNDNGEIIYEITISNLTGNGPLSIIFPEGLIIDTMNQKNDFQKFNTGITIDNISPTISCEELSIENNKSKYIITSNEYLRNINGWNMSENNTSLYKNFSSPVYYPITISDYAGNQTETFVNIRNAKNIMLYYANYNGYSVSKFNSNGEISGEQAIIDSSNKKSEMIVTYLDGDINSSMLQSRIFDYTYWGENTSAICNYSEIDFKYGYSPSPTDWYDINSKNAIRFLGKISLQLGGQGHNLTNKTSNKKNDPIPEEIAKQNLYGISGISFKLKDLQEYSIVYQVYVPEIGWIKCSSDGEECTYSHDKPFSAIRINIVPSSEKEYLMDYWNKIIYTNYVS